MPKSVDSNIYGTDSNSFAEGIASDALANTKGDYIWGGIQDDRAIAKANVGAESTGPSDPDTPTIDGNMAGGGDNEKLGEFSAGKQRHARGPSTSTDSQPKNLVPKNQTGRPGKLPGPAYSRKVTDTGDGVS